MDLGSFVLQIVLGITRGGEITLWGSEWLELWINFLFLNYNWRLNWPFEPFLSLGFIELGIMLITKRSYLDKPSFLAGSES